MSVTTAIKVISLEASTGRRMTFSQDAKASTSEWAYFPAYSGASLPLNYSPKTAIRRFGRRLSEGEIGCYTSHFKAWEWLLQSSFDQMIVFEDDAIVNWPLMAEISAYDFHSLGIDLLRMHITNRFKSKTITHKFVATNCELQLGIGLVLGGAAYLLTRAGAEKLVQNTNIAWPLDWELGAYWRHGVKSHILFPFPAMTRFVPSTLSDDRQKIPYSSGPIDKLAYIKNKLTEKFLKLRAEVKYVTGK